MAWYRVDSFRSQMLVIVVASLSMAALTALLVKDAWQGTRATLMHEAEQQCTAAVRELKVQFDDRASLLAASGEPPLSFELQDVSLKGLAAVVLRSYQGLEGGFLLGPEQQIAGRASSSGDAELQQLDRIELGLLWRLAEHSSTNERLAIDNAEAPTGFIVSAVMAFPSQNVAVWTLKRLKTIDDPTAERRRWWLTSLVLCAVLGLSAIVSISVRLRRGVDMLNEGISKIESDFSHRLAPIPGDFGRVATAINNMADRRGALETTIRRQDRLAALGRVVAGVAHEIRNPLNSLALTLELLEHRMKKGTATGEEVREAISEVDRLGEILARLLAFGRADLENRQLHNLPLLLDRVVRVVHEQAARKGIKLELPIYVDDKYQVHVDALGIEQVLINLLLNAIDASPEGATVCIRIASKPDHVRIEVHDDGPGLPETVRDHIFDPYFTTKENGNGLGLSVSREIVSRHGGTLDFESHGKGTTFVVTFPAVERSVN